MPFDDRDRQLDQALARHLRRSSSDPCPDAEILAAYHEGTLAPDELLVFNQHLSDCKMCQESLAILAESDEVPAGREEWKEWKEHEAFDFGDSVPGAAPRSAMPAAPAPISAVGEASAAPVAPAQLLHKYRPRALRFLIPIGALAAVGLVWVGLREHKNTVEVAQVREQRDSLQQQISKPQPVPQENSAALNSAPLIVQSTPPPPPPEKKNEKKQKSAASTDELSQRQQMSELRERILRDQLASNLEQPQDYSKSLRVYPRAGAGSAAPAPVTGGRSMSGRLNAPSPPAVLAKKSPDAPQQSTQAVSPVQAYLRDAAATNPAVILSPGKTQVWIVGNAGGIKRGTGDGQTWIAQNSGVVADLIAGYAPSSSIVWIVGKSGTVLVTSDGGENWKKIASPVSSDLAGVQATDAKNARIWDSANHQYTTTDGGATWKPVTN